MLQHLASDVRYGLRSLLARPGFLAAAMLTLALGIGANAAVFSVINTLLLKPLPFGESERLVDIYNSYPGNGLPIAGVSVPDYLDRRDQAPALADSAMFTQQSFNLAEQGTQPERLTGVVTTPSLFSTLGANAERGRVLAQDDASAGNEHVAVLSHALWNNRFGADPAIVGRDVRLNGDTYRVVGVMPEGFFFPDRHAELWTPFVFTDKQRSDDERGHEFSGMVGRLKPGATIPELNAQMDTIIHRNVDRALAGPRGEGWKRFVESSGFSGRARPLRDAYVGDLRPTLWLLQALVACVLLIACANVANLVLTRLSARQKEMSVRAALGAGRMRIARQLLVESLLLSLAGGAVGIALAYIGVALIRKLGLGGPADALHDHDRQLGAAVLACARARHRDSVRQRAGALAVAQSLRGRFEGRWARAGRRAPPRARCATRSSSCRWPPAVSLLGVAGLLIRSFVHVQEQSPGFSSDNVLSATIDLPAQRYKDDTSKAQFYERMLGEARALPGVISAGLVNNMPFSGNDGSGNYMVEGVDPKTGTFPHAYSQMVDEDFFRTMQIPVREGRSFAGGDTAGRAAGRDRRRAARAQVFPGPEPDRQARQRRLRHDRLHRRRNG